MSLKQKAAPKVFPKGFLESNSNAGAARPLSGSGSLGYTAPLVQPDRNLDFLSTSPLFSA